MPPATDPTPAPPGQPQWLGDDDIALGGVWGLVPRTGMIPERDTHLIVWFKHGALTLTADGQAPLQAGPNRPVILSASVSYHFHTTAERLTLLRISDHYLHLTAAEEGTPLPERVAFAQQDDSTAAVALLRTLLNEVAAAITSPDTPTPLRAHINARVARTVLHTFSMLEEPLDPTNPVHAVILLIQHHYPEPITITQMAEAANRSPRSLQQAFRTQLGTTPLTYLRDYRLDRARAVLRAGWPVAIREVARSVGFTHLGRFAGNYAARFGESPSDTLRYARHKLTNPHMNLSAPSGPRPNGP